MPHLRDTHAHHRRRFRAACDRAAADGVDVDALTFERARDARTGRIAEVGSRFSEMVLAFYGQPTTREGVGVDDRQREIPL